MNGQACQACCMWSNEPCLCFAALWCLSTTTAVLPQLTFGFFSSSPFAAVLVGELLQQHRLQSAQASFHGLALSNKLELVSPRGLRNVNINNIVEHARGRITTQNGAGNTASLRHGSEGVCMCIVFALALMAQTLLWLSCSTECQLARTVVPAQQYMIRFREHCTQHAVIIGVEVYEQASNVFRNLSSPTWIASSMPSKCHAVPRRRMPRLSLRR